MRASDWLGGANHGAAKDIFNALNSNTVLQRVCGRDLVLETGVPRGGLQLSVVQATCRRIAQFGMTFA